MPPRTDFTIDDETNPDFELGIAVYNINLAWENIENTTQAAQAMTYAANILQECNSTNTAFWQQILINDLLANGQLAALQPELARRILTGIEREYFAALNESDDWATLKQWVVYTVQTLAQHLQQLASQNAEIVLSANRKFTTLIELIETAIAENNTKEVDNLLTQLEQILSRSSLSRDLVSAYSVNMYGLVDKLKKLYQVRLPAKDVRSTLRTGWKEMLGQIFTFREHRKRVNQLIKHLEG